MRPVMIVGGTSGIGLELARHYVCAGREVILTGRDAERAGKLAEQLSDHATGLGFDLSRPEEIPGALTGVGPIGSLVLAGVNRDQSSIGEFDIAAAQHLAMVKIVGYVAVVSALRDRLPDDGAVLIFGGQARVRPYPGSTTVSTVNAGMLGMVRTLAVELAPMRVNSIHPGIVGDSPFWRVKPEPVLAAVRAGTLTGRMATMADVVGASVFLLENPAVNDVNLVVDGGWR